jgi:hypothetical protein
VNNFSESYQPLLGACFYNGWFSNITFIKEGASINDNGDVIKIETQINYYGTFQPLKIKPRSLEIKSYEQRAWKWVQIHSTTDLMLTEGDRIIFQNKKYKVMKDFDYNLNGFYEYYCIEDFTDLVPNNEVM